MFVNETLDKKSLKISLLTLLILEYTLILLGVIQGQVLYAFKIAPFVQIMVIYADRMNFIFCENLASS